MLMWASLLVLNIKLQVCFVYDISRLARDSMEAAISVKQRDYINQPEVLTARLRNPRQVGIKMRIRQRESP